MRYIIIILIIVTSHMFVFAQEDTLVVDISKSQPYLGELFTYSVSFRSTLDLSNAQIQLPQFIGFAQQPKQPSLSTETINTTTYNVLQQEIMLYGNRVGDFVLEATTVIVPDTPFQSGTQVQSNTIAVNVLALPADAPDTFRNAVGQFDISVNLEPTIIQAGEPNLLSISISGQGNFDQITDIPLRLPDTWEVFKRPTLSSNTNQSVQTKTFQYQIFADQTGNTTVPAVLFTFFDPLTASYKTITSQEVVFTVEGEFTTQNEVSINPQSPSNLPLKPMTAQASTILPATGFWILWIIPPIIVLIISLVQFASRPRQQQTHRRRKQSRPLKTAIAQLTQAQQQSPTQIYSIVEQTIIQYIAEAYRQDMNTANSVSDIITDLSALLQQKILTCLEQAQSGQYAPVTQDDANKLLRRTYKTLHLIEEERS